MKVEWTDDLSIGIGIIDDQHKKLVERVKSFVEAVACKDMDKIADTVNYLIGYAVQHFGAEELLMIRNNYDEFKSHREEHTWFINKVYDVHKSIVNKQLTIEDIEGLRDALVKWTVDHIKIKDKRISEHIR